MATGIQFVFFVVVAYTICNTGAQELFIDKYLQNLKKNMEILKKGKENDDDYPDDEYFYDDKEDYEPVTKSPPSRPTAGKGSAKSKEPEIVKSDTNIRGGSKKSPNARKKDDIEPTNTRPPPAARPGKPQSLDQGLEQKSGKKSAAAGTLKVLTVKKFMFQAKPVTPVGKRTPETMNIYYTL